MSKYQIYSVHLIIFILVVIGHAFGQNAEEDLKQISLKFQNERVMLHQQINYFETYDAKEPIESNASILKRDNELLYMSAFGTETLINNGISLLIDHQSKTMLLDKNDGSEFESGLAIDITTLKEKSSEIKYKLKGISAYYTFSFLEGEQLKTEIWFNKEKLEVQKIVIYMRDKARLEMIITDLKTNCDFDSTTFSLEQFITNSDNGIVPKEKFKNYKLINNIRN